MTVSQAHTLVTVALALTAVLPESLGPMGLHPDGSRLWECELRRRIIDLKRLHLKKMDFG